MKEIHADVVVAQLVERPFKGPSKRCNSLTDPGSNPSHGIRWQEKILAEASMGERGNKLVVWEVEQKILASVRLLSKISLKQ